MLLPLTSISVTNCVAASGEPEKKKKKKKHGEEDAKVEAAEEGARKFPSHTI